MLDTNILSEPARPRPKAALMEKLHRYSGSVATASVVIHELTLGVQRLPSSSRREWLTAYLEGLLASSMPVLHYDRRAAIWHAEERARLERRGRPVPFADGQIAAIARVNDLVLVTANPKDYRWFSGLEIENWRDSS